VLRPFFRANVRRGARRAVLEDLNLGFGLSCRLSRLGASYHESLLFAVLLLELRAGGDLLGAALQLFACLLALVGGFQLPLVDNALVALEVAISKTAPAHKKTESP